MTDSESEQPVAMKARGVVLLASALACVAFVSLPRSAPVALQSTCIPCTSGAGCSAGCRSGAELPVRAARTQELTLVAPARRRAMRARAHQSLRGQDEAMKRINKRLLRLSTHEGKGELGSVLNSAMGEVLRAEEAEVQLRRLAALQKESSINSAVNHLGSSDQQLFKLRATEFELALKQVLTLPPLTPCTLPPYWHPGPRTSPCSPAAPLSPSFHSRSEPHTPPPHVRANSTLSRSTHLFDCSPQNA